MEKEILDIHEACELLGVKERTMYTLLKTKQVPAIKVGGQWRFHRAMILNMFREQQSLNKSDPESPEESGK